jgi:hypothetical protein
MWLVTTNDVFENTPPKYLILGRKKLVIWVF